MASYAFAVPRVCGEASFGGGAHICAGMRLANLEIIATLHDWLMRIPEFRLTEGFQLIARSGVVAQAERVDMEWNKA
jgi:cytochrome P450